MVTSINIRHVRLNAGITLSTPAPGTNRILRSEQMLIEIPCEIREHGRQHRNLPRPCGSTLKGVGESCGFLAAPLFFSVPAV